MSEKIVQLNEEVIKGQLKKLVRHISRNWYETAWREPLTSCWWMIANSGLLRPVLRSKTAAMRS